MAMLGFPLHSHKQSTQKCQVWEVPRRVSPRTCHVTFAYKYPRCLVDFFWWTSIPMDPIDGSHMNPIDPIKSSPRIKKPRRRNSQDCKVVLPSVMRRRGWFHKSPRTRSRWWHLKHVWPFSPLLPWGFMIQIDGSHIFWNGLVVETTN